MHRKIPLTLFIVISVNILPFQFNNDNLSEKIIGEWKMIKVFEMSEDVSVDHNPANDRWIRFIQDSANGNKGTFESGRGEETENSGKWIINKMENELFIDSDVGEDDDSYWGISFNENKMYWEGKRFEFNKRFKIIHERID